jgi:hypothetical protein
VEIQIVAVWKRKFGWQREARVFSVTNGSAQVKKRANGTIMVEFTGQDRKVR